MDETATSAPTTLAMIGFGEAAGAFHGGWRLDGVTSIRAYDIKSTRPETRQPLERRLAEAEVDMAQTHAALLEDAVLVVSLVTADQALVAARAAAPHIPAGSIYVDGNSCAPQTKEEAAALIEASGAYYVDMAIMSPVYPKRQETPVLLSGSRAEQARALLGALGMVPRIVGTGVGRASGIKMMRSIMIKGFEAVIAECVLSARRFGVEEEVFSSLERSDPDVAWRSRASYSLERMMVHGLRRSAEMQEVALTVDKLGLPNRMSAAVAAWQSDIGNLALDGGEDDLFDRADRILAALGSG